MSSSSPTQPRKAWKTIAVVIGLLFVAWVGINGVANSCALNYYACLDAAAVLQFHVATHEGRWPRGWADLREDYQRAPGVRAIYPNVDHLAEHVEIDFSFDPQRASGPALQVENPPRLIWTRRGFDLLDGSRWASGNVVKYLLNPAAYPALAEFSSQSATTKPAH